MFTKIKVQNYTSRQHHDHHESVILFILKVEMQECKMKKTAFEHRNIFVCHASFL